MTQPNSEPPGTPPSGDANDPGRADIRCGCGSLLAKLVERGVELKCRRCKKIVLIPFDEMEGGEGHVVVP